MIRPARTVGPAFLAALALSCVVVPLASAQVTVTAPAESPPGAAFEVVAEVAPGADVAQLELLYRSAVTPEIRALVMEPAAGRRFRAVVPGEHAVPPGVELVLRIRDRQGQTRLQFKVDPGRPYIVAVREGGAPAAGAEPPPIAELIPAPGSAVVGRRPTLIARLAQDATPPARGQVMVTIDGVDMTSQLEISGREIRLRPASALTPGPHEAVISLLDAQGQPRAPQSWPFTVRDFPAVQEGSLGIGLSGTYEYAVARLLGSDPRWTANANVHVDGRLAEGGFEATLLGDLRYLDQNPGDNPGGKRDIDLAGHLLTLLYNRDAFKGRLELGEIAVRETTLTTGASFARRGGQLAARVQETELHLFATDAVPLFGWENFTGVNDPNERVHGGSLSHGLPDDRLVLKLTALGGRFTPQRPLGTGVLGQAAQLQQQAYNIGSAGGGFDATTYSIGLSSKLFDGKLRAEAEGAWSRRLLFSAAELGAVRDETGPHDDEAWRARVEGDALGVRAGLEYQRVGNFFLSPGNPTLVADREEVALDFQTALGPVSWQFRLSRGHDNVRDSGALPSTTEWKFAPSVTLALPDAPILTAFYLGSDQRTERPIDGQPLRIVTQGGGVTASYAMPLWFASLTPSYYDQDATRPDRETDTRSLTLALGITPASWFTVSPSYTFTQTRDFTSGADTDTHVPSLTARLELVPNLVTLDTQGSYVATADDRNTIDTETLAGLLRLTVNLKRFLPGSLAPAASVRANYARTKDHLVATNSREDYGVFLIFDVFASLGLLPAPTLDWLPSSARPSPVVPSPAATSAVGVKY